MGVVKDSILSRPQAFISAGLQSRPCSFPGVKGRAEGCGGTTNGFLSNCSGSMEQW